jgi:hypothetical protein
VPDASGMKVLKPIDYNDLKKQMDNLWVIS